MTLKDEIRNILNEALKDAVREGILPEADYPPFRLEYPKETKFGDYSTPFAMESAKILHRAPADTAAKLKPYIEKNPVIGKVEIANPGYLNLFISMDRLNSALKDIQIQDRNYGCSSKEKPLRVNIEFVSANPTGPMNVVSARAAALGDTIAALFQASGDAPEREFYVNDYGNQVRMLGLSVLARIREIRGEHSEFPEEGYHGEYVKDIAAWMIKEHSDTLQKISDETELINFCARTAVEYNISGQQKDLSDFNVTFDRWFREKSLHDADAVKETFNILDKKGFIYEQDGKKFFRSTDFGDDKDRVVIRDDGRPTYLLADIAYHRNKIERGYDMIIDIWGPDHHGYIARLSGAVQALGFPPEKFKVLISQQVNLVMNGETVKMSKRLGNFSTMRELVDEIGVDVSRYFFLMRSMDSHLDFDLALAKKDSSENPVFYLQYAHARICSLFREAQARGIKYTQGVFDGSFLNDDDTVHLMKLAARYPEEIQDASAAIEPHRIPSFLMKTAQAYHRFYTDHRILTDDEARTCAYLNLCDAVRRVLRNGLEILGVSAPEKM